MGLVINCLYFLMNLFPFFTCIVEINDQFFIAFVYDVE